MKEAFGDIWELSQYNYDAIVITTNGFVKKNGEAVMGRGIALEARERYPSLPANLGKWITENGNIPGITYIEPNVSVFDVWRPYRLITFPVKPVFGPRGEPGWRAKADIDLIRESAHGVVKLVDAADLGSIIMPRPGCGNGGLKWEDVKPVIEPILDDRFTVVTWHP